MTTILQLAGLPDTDDIVLETTDETGQRRLLNTNWISPLLEPLNPAQFRHLKLLYGGAENPIRLKITPDIVYNSISDPERFSRALERAEHDAKKNPFPIINLPSNIPNVRPDRLYRTVAGMKGITMPKTLRITPLCLEDVKAAMATGGLKLPILFKEAAAYPETPNYYILDSYDDIHALERFAFDGRAYYASEFHDYRSADGLYRLYRFYVIGDTVLPGHLIVSEQWHIRNDESAHRGLKGQMSKVLKEEKEFLKRFRKKKLPLLPLLKKQLGLDYFAAEFAIDKKGELLLFGVTADAHFADGVKESGYFGAKEVEQFNQAVEAMLEAKRPPEKAHHV